MVNIPFLNIHSISQPGNSLYTGRLPYEQLLTNCRIGFYYKENKIWTAKKLSSPQLVDNCTYGTIAFPCRKSSLSQSFSFCKYILWSSLYFLNDVTSHWWDLMIKLNNWDHIWEQTCQQGLQNIIANGRPIAINVTVGSNAHI